jgi:tetratricopeptide (TPR) repeat protein
MMMGFRQTVIGVYATGLLAVGMLNSAGAQGLREDEFQTLLKQGFDFHQQARYAEAIPVLEHARNLEPGDYFANLLLGIDLLRTGKAVKALPRLELAARANPGEEIPEDYLGEAEASLGRYAQAAEAYQQATERGHDSEQALEAWAGFALERFRGISQSLRASAAGVVTVRRLQEAALRPGSTVRCAGSIPSLERRMTANSASRQPAREDLETAYNLSICYAVEAGKAAERLQASNEDGAALGRLRGDVLLLLKGDAAAAQEEYGKAIALRPGDPALLERLAQARLTAGDTEGARTSAHAALAIDPHRREAMRTLVSLAMSSRDYGKALPWLRQLAVEAPADRTVQVDLGRALALTGDEAAALRYLGPALAAGFPDEKGALHALEAHVLSELGREEEAAKASAEARRLSDAFQARSKDGSNENVNGIQ